MASGGCSDEPVLSDREAILRQTSLPGLEFLTMRDALTCASVSWFLCELVSPHISAFVRQDGGEVAEWHTQAEDEVKSTGHAGLESKFTGSTYVAADTSYCKQQ